MRQSSVEIILMNLHRVYVTLADFGYPVYVLWLYIFQNCKNVCRSIFRIWSVPDEGCDKNAQCALNLIFTFIFITV